MKVAELLEIVASQHCIYGNVTLFVHSKNLPQLELTLLVGDFGLGKVRGLYSEKQPLKLETLFQRLKSLEDEDEVTVRYNPKEHFEIGFMAFDEGFIQTVTSEELGLSEEPQ